MPDKAQVLLETMNNENLKASVMIEHTCDICEELARTDVFAVHDSTLLHSSVLLLIITEIFGSSLIV